MLCLLWNYIYEKKQWLKITFKTHLDDRCFGSQINPKPKIILVANGKLDLQVTEALERGLQVFEKKKTKHKNQNKPKHSRSNLSEFHRCWITEQRTGKCTVISRL